MSDGLSLAALATSVLLPWVLGCTWVYFLIRKSGRYNYFIVLGHGYLIGLILTTFIIRANSVFEVALSFWSIALPMVALSLIGCLGIAMSKHTVSKSVNSRPSQGWEKLLITAFLILIFYRVYTLANEMMLRPLFAWDSWMNWAPKAIVWHNFSELIVFDRPYAWPSDPEKYTLGNWKAWKYPPTVPLIQLWSMFCLGISKHPAVYLPWLVLLLSLGIALYGHLRLARSSALLASMAVYLLFSLPYLNTHVVLAGYADIWLSAAFGLAVFALAEWGENRHWSYGVLIIMLALGATQLKIPGIVIGAIIAIVLLTPRNIKLRRLLPVIFILCITFLFFIANMGISIDLSSLGRIEVTNESLHLPYFGSYPILFHNVSNKIFESLFLSANWHFLWYLFVIIIAVKVKRGALAKPLSNELLAISLVMAFIAFVFYFTNHFNGAVHFQTLNRAILYLVPAIVFYTFKEVSK